ncbi:MAG: helix-turn-helix domain-containing protein [Lachnospiraceae bacterium]|nr:helix-turn-helix domain-containing protein [Lachnospiraceae bacterium]
MNTGEKIKELRELSGMTQEELGARLGLKKAAINKYETGRVVNLKRSTIEKLCEIFNVLPQELMGMDDNAAPSSSNIIMPSAKKLPIVGVVCAGDGVYCQDDFQGSFIIDIQVDADFCLKVKGNSMEGAQIYDGDIAFIKKDDYFNDGDIYAVERLDLSEASLKKVYINDNSVMLIPCNSDYSPVATTLDQIRIIGRCVGVYHNR